MTLLITYFFALPVSFLSKHNAPPVVYPVHRPQALIAIVMLLWGIGAAALVVWLANDRISDAVLTWRDGLAAAALLASTAGAVSFCKTGDQGHLVWDGEFWHKEGEASLQRRRFTIFGLFGQTMASADVQAQVQVQVIFDMQAAMLLQMTRGQGAPEWTWVTRSAHPERWLDLRRAVYSPIRHAVSEGEPAWNASSRKV